MDRLHAYRQAEQREHRIDPARITPSPNRSAPRLPCQPVQRINVEGWLFPASVQGGGELVQPILYRTSAAAWAAYRAITRRAADAGVALCDAMLFLVPIAAAGPGIPGEEAPVPGIDVPAPDACTGVEAVLRETRGHPRSDDAARIDAAVSPVCRHVVTEGAWTSLVPLVRERVLFDQDGYPTTHQRQTEGQVRALCRLWPPDGIAEMRTVLDLHPDGGEDADLCTVGLAERLDDAAFAEAVRRWMGVMREMTDMGPWIVWGAGRVARVAPQMTDAQRERFAPMLVEADAREAAGRDELRRALCGGPESRGAALTAACLAKAPDAEAVATGRSERTQRLVRTAVRCGAAVGWVFYALHAIGPGGDAPRRGRFMSRVSRRAEVASASGFVVAGFFSFFLLLWSLGPPEGMLLPVSGLFHAVVAFGGAWVFGMAGSALALVTVPSRTAVLIAALGAATVIVTFEWMPLPGTG